MTKRILIATGGTGGHIYPAIALAEQLTSQIPSCRILFVGGGLEQNRYFDKSFPWHSIECAAFVNKSPLAITKSLFKIGKGLWQSRRVIDQFRPDIAVGFGSFYSFPPLLASLMMSVPVVLHEANSIPGKVNRLLSRYATVSAVHFPKTCGLLKGNTQEAGMPLRHGFMRTELSHEGAKKAYGLDPQVPVVLVFGGSQGAKVVNEAAYLALLHQQSPIQALHIVGPLESIAAWEERYAKSGIVAKVKAFEPKMAIAWQAADVVISRAGAGTIAEQLEFEVPGILIPFARAADHHQEYNADFMVDHVGGAQKIREDELDLEGNVSAHSKQKSTRLTDALQALLQPQKAADMRTAMQNYKTRSQRKELCTLVREIIG